MLESSEAMAVLMIRGNVVFAALSPSVDIDINLKLPLTRKLGAKERHLSAFDGKIPILYNLIVSLPFHQKFCDVKRVSPLVYPAFNKSIYFLKKSW